MWKLVRTISHMAAPHEEYINWSSFQGHGINGQGQMGSSLKKLVGAISHKRVEGS